MRVLTVYAHPNPMSFCHAALTSQGLNVHAGHDDVMSVADCGWGMVLARNAHDRHDSALRDGYPPR